MKQKAQQEIIGFVLIVVIVSIIGVIFLSLSIGRGEPSKQTSVEISNLLQSSMYYTTDCATSFIPQYKDGQDLIKACREEEKCLDGRLACEVLNSTLKELIEENLNICDDGNVCKNKAYEISIYYTPLDLSLPNDAILNLEKGEFDKCSSSFGGSHAIYLSSITAGTIHVELEVCEH